MSRAYKLPVAAVAAKNARQGRKGWGGVALDLKIESFAAKHGPSPRSLASKHPIATLNPDSAVDRFVLRQGPDPIGVDQVLDVYQVGGGRYAPDCTVRKAPGRVAPPCGWRWRVVAPCQSPSEPHARVRSTAESRLKQRPLVGSHHARARSAQRIQDLFRCVAGLFRSGLDQDRPGGGVFRIRSCQFRSRPWHNRVDLAISRAEPPAS